MDGLFESPGSAELTRLILFDLGGVLVVWDGIAPLIRLSRRRLSPEEARRFWLESPWVRRFERGKCTAGEFARGVVDELELAIGPERFLEEFLSWDRGPMPGAGELLSELGRKYTLACLSNNNALHWSRLRDEGGFGKVFQHCFLSHEMGLVKPDREIFDEVLRRLPFRKEEIVFLDDNPECVEGAREAGIRAFTARGPEEVRALVRRLEEGQLTTGRR